MIRAGMSHVLMFFVFYDHDGPIRNQSLFGTQQDCVLIAFTVDFDIVHIGQCQAV